VAAAVAMRSECRRIALARHNAANDAHPTRTRDVGHDVVQLDIHLHQGLLHVLNVRGGIVQQPFSLAQVGAQCRQLAFRSEAGPQQPVFVQPQPLNIADIGLATRDVLGVTGVDQHHFEAALIENLERRNPVDTGRLHCDRAKRRNSRTSPPCGAGRP
jgi:hypothetical protein